MRISVFFVTALLLAGCAALGGPKGPSSAEDSRAGAAADSAEPDDQLGDEEKGIKGITELLKQFSRTLNGKDFDGAGRYLRKAELALQHADELTRAHPEFEDKEAAVERAKSRFKETLERDRIARRNAAIEEIIKRGEADMAEARKLFAAINQRVPTSDDTKALADLLNRFASLARNGKDYENSGPYLAHAETRDAMVQALEARLQLAEWQIATSKYIDASIRGAKEATIAGQKTKKQNEQIAAMQTVVASYKQCVEQFDTLAERPDYDGKRLIATSLGEMSLDDARKACVERFGKFSAQLAEFNWVSLVKATLAQVDAKLGATRAADSARQKLSTLSESVAALEACAAELDKGMRSSGYDKKMEFSSALGQGTVPKLARACRSEAASLSASKPLIAWRAEAEGLASTLTSLQGALSAAETAKETATKRSAWESARKELETCADKAAVLNGRKPSDRRFPIATPLGDMTVVALERECRKRALFAAERRDNAEREAKLARFLETLKGDEIRIAKEKGIPTRIEDVKGGRIFHYDPVPKKAKAVKFGFNSKGEATDFDKRFAEGMLKLQRDIDKMVGQIGKAPDGTTRLASVESALPYLDGCAKSLSGIENSPGFDSKLRVKSVLGRKTATEMRRACEAKANELRNAVPKVRWVIELEKVAALALKASTLLDGAKSEKGAAKRVASIGQAIGALSECVERGQTVSTRPAADPKAQIRSPYGKVNREELVKGCADAKTEAQQALVKAREAQKLETFIEEAQGDEKAVARREGMPDSIERRPKGRIFVYVVKGRRGKKTEKRFGFDTKGRRVPDELLEDDGKSRKESKEIDSKKPSSGPRQK